MLTKETDPFSLLQSHVLSYINSHTCIAVPLERDAFHANVCS